MKPCGSQHEKDGVCTLGRDLWKKSPKRARKSGRDQWRGLCNIYNDADGLTVKTDEHESRIVTLWLI